MQPPPVGIKIANSRGVPGTLGCIVRSLPDNRSLLLSNWHVLFGKGARKNDPLWLVEESRGGRRFREVGKILYGYMGMVWFGSEEHYVDCAVASWFGPAEQLEHSARSELTVQPGCFVKKTGAATGTTTGVVVDVAYSPNCANGGLRSLTPKAVQRQAAGIRRQLLIHPTHCCPVFSAGGDSGALVTDTEDRAVGLLWGSTSRGEGIACHIGPILHSLNIALHLPRCKAERPGLAYE